MLDFRELPDSVPPQRMGGSELVHVTLRNGKVLTNRDNCGEELKDTADNYSEQGFIVTRSKSGLFKHTLRVPFYTLKMLFAQPLGYMYQSFSGPRTTGGTSSDRA